MADTDDCIEKYGNWQGAHLKDVLPLLSEIAENDYDRWMWYRNPPCKYLTLRMDTRDGGRVRIFDRDQKLISIQEAMLQEGRPRAEDLDMSDLLVVLPPYLHPVHKGKKAAGMIAHNFLVALSTGLSARRKSWESNKVLHMGEDGQIYLDAETLWAPTQDDLLADDWMLGD